MFNGRKGKAGTAKAANPSNRGRRRSQDDRDRARTGELSAEQIRAYAKKRGISRDNLGSDKSAGSASAPP